MSQPKLSPNTNPDLNNSPEFKQLLIKFKKQCDKYLNSRYLTILIIAIDSNSIEYYTITLSDTKFHLRRTFKTQLALDLSNYLSHFGCPKNDEIEPPVNLNYKAGYDYYLVGTELLKQIK